MSAVWFSSDTHFLHAMVAGLRGFTGSAEHDETVIDRWNKLVRPDDLVWHLGDVGLGNETRVLEQAARLNGRKQLITGNHDPCWPGRRDSRKRQRYWLDVFESVQAFAKTRIGGQSVLLSHFPYEGDHTGLDRATQFRLRDEGEWLIHGHTHLQNRLGPNPRYLTLMDPATGGPGASRPLGREVHAGLDAWDLRPVSEAAILGVIREYEASMDMDAAAGVARERLEAIRSVRAAPPAALPGGPETAV
jgi:calcineurin-like phosphoesterase family protein